MYLLTGKSHLARSISKLQRICLYSDFTPRTWILPLDYHAVTKLLADGKCERCVIVKQARVRCENFTVFYIHDSDFSEIIREITSIWPSHRI